MRIILSLVTGLLLTACELKKQPKQPADSYNQLTVEEKNNGWILLFDGKTLNGWRFFKNQANNSWEVTDGALHCKAFADGTLNERSDLITTGEYGDFELSFQWKISHQGNSGVMFRVTEAYDQTYASGPEYQVIDEENYPGDLPPENKAAANFGMHAADNAIVSPVEQWNDGKIIVQGNHVEHWLNGTRVLVYDLFSDDWNKRRNAGKWKDFPGYASARKGYIALQDHGNEVWYRAIKIKLL
ncbi:MAG: DUF1080 domain-containing protein [Cyclobacteriaceae bacterium]|nr:DUF1080 domain-containing protein [Cyclobacteriaceae bacterium]